MSTLLFFRGFNTYADDDLRFGPLNLGRAHEHIEPRFTNSGFHFFALPGIGRGLPKNQFPLAHQNLQDLCRAHKLSGSLHLLGHSAGGVIARGFAHYMENNPITDLTVKSVTSIASPHRGSHLAEMITQNKIYSPTLQKILNTKVYNLRRKQPEFAPWTPEQLSLFNSQFADLPHIQYASIISGTESHRLPFLLQLVHKILHEKKSITDGIVELSSQSWGQVLGQFELDHGAELGVRTTLLPHVHRRNQKQFSKMIDKIIAHIQSVEYNSGHE